MILRLYSVLRIVSLNLDLFTLECVGRGDTFDRMVHASGTEIKAITYSAMDIKYNNPCKNANEVEVQDNKKNDKGCKIGSVDNNDATSSAHIYVIVDI